MKPRNPSWRSLLADFGWAHAIMMGVYLFFLVALAFLFYSTSGFLFDETSSFEIDFLPRFQNGFLLTCVASVVILVYALTLRRIRATDRLLATEVRKLVYGLTPKEGLQVLDDKVELYLVVISFLATSLSFWNPYLSSATGVLTLILSVFLWGAYKLAKVKRAIDLRLFAIDHAAIFFIVCIGTLVYFSSMKLVLDYLQFIDPMILFTILLGSLVIYLISLFAVRRYAHGYTNRVWQSLAVKGTEPDAIFKSNIRVSKKESKLEHLKSAIKDAIVTKKRDEHSFNEELSLSTMSVVNRLSYRTFIWVLIFWSAVLWVGAIEGDIFSLVFATFATYAAAPGIIIEVFASADGTQILWDENNDKLVWLPEVAELLQSQPSESEASLVPVELLEKARARLTLPEPEGRQEYTLTALFCTILILATVLYIIWIAVA